MSLVDRTIYQFVNNNISTQILEKILGLEEERVYFGREKC